MTYIEKARLALEEELGDPKLNPRLIDLYTLLVLTTGEKTTSEHVHNAWAVWRARTKKDHPHIVPFDELPTQEVKALDVLYAQAIREVARLVKSEL